MNLNKLEHTPLNLSLIIEAPMLGFIGFRLRLLVRLWFGVSFQSVHGYPNASLSS